MQTWWLVALVVTLVAVFVATWWHLQSSTTLRAQRSTTLCANSRNALEKLRKQFGGMMKLLGQLRKQGRDPHFPCGHDFVAVNELHDMTDMNEFTIVARWSWLTYRKVAGRTFHDMQMVLEGLKRDREARLFGDTVTGSFGRGRRRFFRCCRSRRCSL